MSELSGYLETGEFTESQRSTVEVGRDNVRSSNPTYLLKQAHPEHLAEDCVQMALEFIVMKINMSHGQVTLIGNTVL